MPNRSIPSQPIDGPQNESAWLKRDWFWGTLLAAAVILAYQSAWHAGFVWDDDVYITGNPSLNGLAGLKRIWTTTTAADISPLTTTTFWLVHAFFGVTPSAYHLLNIFLHSACAVVLWRVLRGLRIPGAWLGAALWALHPVEVESVAWASELKNPESCFFFLLSVLFFVKWRRSVGRGNYALVVIFAAFAMACKSSTVILPVVLCLCAWWMEGRCRWRHVVSTAPLFLLSAFASLSSIWFEKVQIASLVDSQWVRTWPQRFVTAGDAIWFYLGKLVWPHPLTAVYPRWDISADAWISWLPLVAALTLLTILWTQRHTWLRPGFFVFAYYLVALLPVLGFIENTIFQYSLVFDHFQYLASIGPLVLAGAAFARAADFLFPRQRALSSALGTALLLMLGVMSWQRAAVYRSSEILWTDALAKNSQCWPAYLNLGLALESRGRIDEAIADYRRALALNPRNPQAYNDLGNAALKKGDVDEAISDYRAACEIDPRFPTPYGNLGNILREKGDANGAIAQYRKSLEIDPAQSTTRNNLGMVYFQRGDFDLAQAEFQKELEYDSDNDLPHYCLGMVYLKKGQPDLAQTEFQRAVEINPQRAEDLAKVLAARAPNNPGDEAIARYQKGVADNPKNAGAHNDLGTALAQGGRLDDAVLEYRKSLELDATDPMARYNLGAVLFQKGAVDGAIAELQKVTALAPNNDVAHYCLGLAYAKKGETEKAVAEYHAALKINPNNAAARRKLDAGH